jgi:hypothetical protein
VEQRENEEDGEAVADEKQLLPADAIGQHAEQHIEGSGEDGRHGEVDERFGFADPCRSG